MSLNLGLKLEEYYIYSLMYACALELHICDCNLQPPRFTIDMFARRVCKTFFFELDVCKTCIADFAGIDLSFIWGPVVFLTGI